MQTTVVNISHSEYDVYIGRANNRRGLKESDWANPFRVGRDGTRDEVIEKYRRYLLGRPDLLARLSELKGKRLGCWCHPEPCHGDVLAELADALEPDTLDPRAGTPTPEPMSEARIAELREDVADVLRETNSTVHRSLLNRYVGHLNECLDEITRLHTVIAEQTAEIGRLRAACVRVKLGIDIEMGQVRRTRRQIARRPLYDWEYLLRHTLAGEDVPE